MAKSRWCSSQPSAALLIVVPSTDAPSGRTLRPGGETQVSGFQQISWNFQENLSQCQILSLAFQSKPKNLHPEQVDELQGDVSFES